MFQIIRNHQYAWPIDVVVPIDGGEFETRRFTGRFRVPDQDRLDGIFSTESENLDTFLLREVLVGWGTDVSDEAGDPIPFSEETRDRLIAIPYVRAAAVRAYYQSMSGVAATPANAE